MREEEGMRWIWTWQERSELARFYPCILCIAGLHGSNQSIVVGYGDYGTYITNIYQAFLD